MACADKIEEIMAEQTKYEEFVDEFLEDAKQDPEVAEALAIAKQANDAANEHVRQALQTVIEVPEMPDWLKQQNESESATETAPATETTTDAATGEESKGEDD